jgi:hypothetical protein
VAATPPKPRARATGPQDTGSPLLAALWRTFGEDACRRAVRALGGTRIRVPARPTAACALAQRIDLHLVVWLSRRFGGSYISFPIGEALKRLEKHRAIVADFDAGMRAGRIAVRHGVCERTVFRALARSRDLYGPTKEHAR